MVNPANSLKLLLLITYDIEDDKGRTKLAIMLKQLGFERLQYSVSSGVCTPAQWKGWYKRIEKLFNHFYREGDKLYVIPQSRQLFEKMQVAGQGFDMEWITGKTEILYY
jgi:CRISPR-associated endonuclease Cas2